MGLLNGGGMDRRFFHRLGASRLDRTICSTAGMAGMTAALGVRYGTEPEQFRHARLILAWGANILGTNVHLWPFIVEARRQGARFYVIDPRRNRTSGVGGQALRHQSGQRHGAGAGHDARHCRRKSVRRRITWRSIRRASTGCASGCARGLRSAAAELTGLAADEIAALAREYAGTRPAVIRLNYGIQRSERGAMAVRTVALLPALRGIVERPGRRAAAFHFAGVSLEPRRLGAPRPAKEGAGTRGAPGEHVGTGRGADHAGRSAGEGAGGLQFEPRGHRSQSERGDARACAAKTCLRWCWNSSRRIPPTTPTSCCR